METETPGKRSTTVVAQWRRPRSPALLGVVGAVEVEALVLCGSLGGDALPGSLGEDGAKGGPVSAELAVDLAHGESVVPEVDEDPDAIALGRLWVLVWHGSSRP